MAKKNKHIGRCACCIYSVRCGYNRCLMGMNAHRSPFKEGYCTGYISKKERAEHLEVLKYYNHFRNAKDVAQLPAIDPEATTKALKFAIRYIKRMKTLIG